MAQRFTVLDWRKNYELNRYYAKIKFEDCVYNYEIITNAKINYINWIDKPILCILDGFDMPFNGNLPYLKITGMSYEARKKEKNLEKAFIEFIKTECSE